MLDEAPTEDGYLNIKRTWKAGDQIRLRLPMALRTEAMPDNPKRMAYFYGPVALAADLSVLDAQWEPGRMPVMLDRGEPLVGFEPTWRFVAHAGRPFAWVLRPLYELTNQPYSVYFDRFTEAEWKEEEARYRVLEEARLALEKRTVDWFPIGQMQPERDHKLKSENSFTGDFAGRHYRDARNGGFFEFEMKLEPEAQQELIFTYWGGDSGRTFDILLDGEKLTTQRLQNDAPGKFFDVVLPLPESLKGKAKVIVRFQARPRGMAGGLFGIRVAKKDR